MSKWLGVALIAILAGAIVVSGERKQNEVPATATASLAEEEISGGEPAATEPSQPAATPAVSSAPVATAGSGAGAEDTRPPLETQQAAKHWNNIASLLACNEDSSACKEKFPETSPSSKYFAIRDRILEEVAYYEAHRPVNAEQREILMKAGHALLSSIPDEQVQGQVIPALPPDPRNPKAVAEALQDVVDVELMGKAIEVFARDGNRENQQVITDFMRSAIDGTSAGVLAANTAAELLGKVLNDGNRADFENLLRTLPPGTPREQAVRRALYGNN